MPSPRVLQAQVKDDGSVQLTVQLTRAEPGEQVFVQSTVSQRGGAAADASTLFALGAGQSGEDVRITLTAAARSGSTFDPDLPLVAVVQATTTWTSSLVPLAVGRPQKFLWLVDDGGWD